MAEIRPEQFEFVGDPNDLPDAAIDALAALLLAMVDQDAAMQCREYSDDETRS